MIRVEVITIALILGVTSEICRADNIQNSPPSKQSQTAQSGPWGVLFFGGILNKEDFAKLFVPGKTKFDDQYFLGTSISRRIATWNHFSVELEGGGGYLFGNDKLAQIWGGVYLRYDDFPWNKMVYTTFAVNTGANYTFKKMAFEAKARGGANRLIHYFAPEVTFASPGNKNLELVFRIHHRSGAWGKLGCRYCGCSL